MDSKGACFNVSFFVGGRMKVMRRLTSLKFLLNEIIYPLVH